jgi:hypothetical protein
VNPKDLPADITRPGDSQGLDEPHGPESLLHGGAFAREPRGEASRGSIQGVLVGELLALADDRTTPLVRFPGQVAMAAVRARSGVDLHSMHIGAAVVLMFERGDPALPIVVGVLQGRSGWQDDPAPSQVDVDADGLRMVVTAQEQLVLRCGKASITLTRAGKVLLEGSYLLCRSTGVNRIKGGAVQIN